MIAHVRDKLCKLVQLHNISFVRILPCVWNGFHLFCVVFSLNITTMNEKWPVDFCKQTNKKMCTQNWIIADRARECKMEKIQSFFYARDSLEKNTTKKGDRMKHQFALNWICWVPTEAVAVDVFFNKCHDANPVKLPWKIM